MKKPASKKKFIPFKKKPGVSPSMKPAKPQFQADKIAAKMLADRDSDGM